MKHLDTIIETGLFDEISKKYHGDAYKQLRISDKKYLPGEAIFLEGDLMEKICVVKSGCIYSEKTYPDGEVHIVDVFEENQIFGLEISVSKSKVATLDYICSEEARVIFIPVKAIARSDYEGRLSRTIMRRLADDNIRTSHKIEILAESGLRDRIMVYLQILQAKSGSNEVNVRMSREQMARFLCVNRSALSNELSKMRREGIIDFSRDKFTIL